jgi:hypothetical protein
LQGKKIIFRIAAIKKDTHNFFGSGPKIDVTLSTPSTSAALAPTLYKQGKSFKKILKGECIKFITGSNK